MRSWLVIAAAVVLSLIPYTSFAQHDAAVAPAIKLTTEQSRNGRGPCPLRGDPRFAELLKRLPAAAVTQ